MGKILSKVEIEKSLNNYRNIGNMDNLYREHYVVSNNLTRDTHGELYPLLQNISS